MSYFDEVGDFHVKMHLPTAASYVPRRGVPACFERCPEFVLTPRLLSDDVWRYRARFLGEELQELDAAHEDCDLAAFADALADLIYVALGTAHLAGLPFDAVWDAVQEANLKKVRATGADDPRSKRGHALDVVKPDGWTAPDHRPALLAAGWAGRGGTR